MTGLLKGLLPNAVRAAATPFSNLLLAALLIVAARLLGDADYGKFAFALSLTLIFETGINFVLNQITTREVARDRLDARLLVESALGLKLMLAAFAAAGLVLSARLLRAELDVRACLLLPRRRVHFPVVHADAATYAPRI